MIREDIKLPQGVQKKIPKLVNILECNRDVAALYSFGSLAKNALKPLSDLDFGILLNHQIGKKGLFDRHLQLIGLFTDLLRTDEIDLILMNYAPIQISFQILRTGKLLLCNDRHALIDFHEHVVRFYLDFKPLRNEFDSTFLKGIGYHG